MTEEAQALALHSAFDETGIKFHDRAAALAALKADGREIVYDDEGTPHTNYDGQMLPMADVLIRFAFDSSDGVCDRRTLPREGAGGGRRGTLSKADLVGYAAKAAFIREHSLSAFEQLPSKPPTSVEVKYREDYFALPRSEKVKLTSLHGPDFATSCRAVLVDSHSAPSSQRTNWKQSKRFDRTARLWSM